jgi:hypothetical protein
MFRPQAILKTQIDKVDNIIDFINTVKPFHTKIVDTVITFVVNESINVRVDEDITTTLDLWFDERSYDKNGFERQGLGKAGLDQYPSEVTPPKLRYELANIYDRLLACMEPESNVYFCGFDDIALDISPLDMRISDGRDLKEGLDLEAFDINSFDFVFIDTAAIERFKNCDISKLRDFHMQSQYLQDDIEDVTPTTIKTTIKETVIIDISRQIPQGFDYMSYSTDNFDSIPREHVAFNITQPGQGSGGGSPSSITLVPITPPLIDLTNDTVNDSEK